MRQIDEPSFSSILTKMIAKLLKNFCFVVFVDISLQTRTWSPTTQQPDCLCQWNCARLSSIWDKEVSQVSAPFSPKWLQNCWKTSVLWLFIDISRQTRTWSPTTQQPDRLCPWNFARSSSKMIQRGEPCFSSILIKMIAKLLKNFCFVVSVDISRQTRTWSPTTQQPDCLCPWNFACLSSNMRQRGEPSFSSILTKLIAKLRKHFCFVVFVDISLQTKPESTLKKKLKNFCFVVVCWHFTANKNMIPNNSSTRSSLPMKLCSPFE